MPLGVDFEWEETSTKVLLRIFLKNVKKSAIDVFIADCFVKVNCTPYLWEADLKHCVDPALSRYGIEEDGTVRISLHKATEKLVWGELRHHPNDPLVHIRREESKQRASEFYNQDLATRERQKVKEEKRFFSEHWELEKQQRAEIEKKVREERQEISRDLAEWQETEQKIVDNSVHRSEFAPIRGRDTTRIEIDFTPAQSIHQPSRTRTEEEHYRRSRYKPQSLEDTPFFFKDRGDKQYNKKDWKGAADSYSEALKRDTCFLAALSNRAVCFLRLHQYHRAVEDCTLALNMLQNTPASNTTGDRFRHGMMKLYARRAAANCWKREYKEGLHDLEMALGYSSGDSLLEGEEASKLHDDLRMLKDKMQGLGLLTEFSTSPLSLKKADADRLITSRKWETAYNTYTEVLTDCPNYWDARCNRVVALLCLQRFKEAKCECDLIISHCQRVADALVDGGVGEMSRAFVDSDDEEDPVSTKRIASETIKQSTSHVYMLLKAYIRKGSACAGLSDYRGAYEYYELALRIMPYDDDLRHDVEAFRQKLQMNNVLAAATDRTDSLQ